MGVLLTAHTWEETVRSVYFSDVAGLSFEC